MLSDPLDAFQQAQALLERLQRQPQAFGQAASVERLQTHISWLLLVGEHVYKFKKPLKLEFLDFSTAALRRAACEEELRINRRTAPQLYLDVVAVVEGDAQSEAQGLGACRTLGVESENAPQRGQFLPDSPPHSGVRAMGQEDDKKWAAAAHSQPTIPKPDRLRGFHPDCPLGGAAHLRGCWWTAAGHFGPCFGVHGNGDGLLTSDQTATPAASPSSRVLMNNLGSSH